MTAMDEGATEIDVVVCLSRVLSGDFAATTELVTTMNQRVTERGGLLKVIFETGLIHDEATKIRLCEICKAAKVAFVKTSTGFATAKNREGALVSCGATVEDVALLVKHAGPVCQVKASGGIRTRADAERFLALGATRIGTGSTASILGDVR
jgi:deoxyribose-phosphate aldolase